MNTNLDRIALDLYSEIETRFNSIKMGDENAEKLSKKTDIPKARFFEFEFKDRGLDLGTITLTLDEEDGLIVQVSGKLADSNHKKAFRFIRSLRQFAKDRLLNFDVQNIGKDNLDKRDYHFQAKPKEEMMEPIMENKMFGTTRMSYQDLGEARLIVKHSRPINPDVPAGRTMHIEGIWVENSDGERFKYPYKHLNGARALAEHLKHGGNLYDNIGQYITSLSEEMVQLRKFKGYVSRNASLSEAMNDITPRVFDRIEEVKKEIHNLQRPAYYEQFAESFKAREDALIPEEIMNDFIDRLTIRTFNEELKTAFPYIFRLIDESDIPVKELSADDLLGEVFDDNKETGTTHKGGKVEKTKHGTKHTKTDYDDGGKNWDKKEPKNRYKKTPVLDPEDQFESFINNIVNEDEEDEYGDGIFDENPDVKNQAITKLNDIFDNELTSGIAGINLEELNKLIPNEEFHSRLEDLINVTKDNSDKDVSTSIELILNDIAKNNSDLAELLQTGQIKFNDNAEPVGGQPATNAPPAPAPAPAPAMSTPPVAESSDDEPPFDKPYRKAKGNIKDKSGAIHTGHSTAKHLAHAGLIQAIHNAKKAGAKLDTTLDFGHKEMTLHDCIEECGMSPADFGFDTLDHENGAQQMLKDISGFWNHNDKNFTIGGTRAKIKVLKGFKDGAYPNATEEDVRNVCSLIDKMDPSSSNASQELGHIKHLAGIHNHEMDEGADEDDFNNMMSQFLATHKGVNPDEMLDKFIQSHPDAQVTHNTTSSGTIDDKPASYDDAMAKFKGMGGSMNPQDMMKNFGSKGMPDMGNMMKNFGGKGMPDMGNMMKGLGGAGMPDMSNMMKNLPNGGNSITVNGKPATQAEFDAFTKQNNVIPGQLPSGQKLTPGQLPSMPGVKMPQLGGNPQDMVNNMMKGFNEDTELTAMLKIAGLR